MEEERVKTGCATMTTASLFSNYWLKRTLVGIAVVISFHTSGANFLNYYSNIILSHHTEAKTATLFSTLHAVCDLLSTGMDFIVMEKVGRKTLYCFGQFASFVGCLCFFLFGTYDLHSG